MARGGLMQQMHADDVQAEVLVVICTCMHAGCKR